VSRRGINREGLAALLPVLEGKEDELRGALEAMPGGPDSPFGRVGSTHFARLVVLDEFPGRNGRTLADMPTCLFFGAEFDATVVGYLEAVCALLPDEADAILGTCVGYPGADVPPLVVDWMLRHRVTPGFSIHGNPQAGVRQVIDSLSRRERIIEFAVETRTLPPAELKDAWDAQDWGNAP
jgi:hypothetical protein